ncbi:MAG: sulfotransferase [Brevundimonas sp.]|uniref:sulfotransferase n=1 Tax=Brevundimonas sp. TaxID=1871086 RepID=UPI00391AB05F
MSKITTGQTLSFSEFVMLSDERPFILVTGAMRSGTTLTGELLYSRAYREQRHPGLCFDNDEGTTTRRLVHRATPPGKDLPDATRVAQEIISLAPGSGEPQVLGAKVTHVFGGLDLLRRRFPNLTLVVCVREPAEIYASHLARTGRTQAECLSICKAINATERLLEKEAGAIVVRYDHLVTNPKAFILTILEAVDLKPPEYDWSSLEAGRVASNSSFGPGQGRRFVEGTGIATFAPDRSLSSVERAIIEASCERAYLRHGFTLQTTDQERACVRGLLP